jgi:hypothetical protein
MILKLIVRSEGTPLVLYHLNCTSPPTKPRDREGLPRCSPIDSAALPRNPELTLNYCPVTPRLRQCKRVRRAGRLMIGEYSAKAIAAIGCWYAE